jgi:fluoride ion exporter CrcB/FEX
VVAVVYKTTKFDQPREIALAALHFFVSVSLGMLALALGFYLFQTLFC